ncbi:MAG: competence/damage-inducible protein A [Oscillospiraceae bacterium]|nr:competence/damage-inducible protein A [Oscillospiraceae bacterium]
MNCEILSVGTELLLGNTINTDAASLSDMLAGLGINVFWHSVVGDNPGRLAESVAIARSRADLIITTGGLGPTYDDLTKTVLAESFGLPLVLHQEEVAGLKCWFSTHDRPFTENNLQQAYLPEGCTVFHNDWGTAPGCAFEKDGVRVIMLPGPPSECLPMFRHCAVPYLKTLSEETIVSHQIRVFGMGESAVEARLRDKMEKMRNPTLATYAKQGDVMLRVTAKAPSHEEAEAMCQPVIQAVKAELGQVVYGVDVESLEALVLSLMTERSLTLSAAESLTGGLIGAKFTALPGASAVFRGGAVTYCDECKAAMLHIDPALIAAHGAVSYETAEAMAKGVRAATGSDLAVSATGLAGPDGDGVNPVGTVFVGLATAERVWVRKLHLGAGRDRVRLLAANNAYDMLRRYLTGLPVLMEKG